MAREFFGSSEINQEDFEGAKRALSAFEENGRIPLEEELKKPDFLKDMVDLANKYVKTELLNQGIVDYKPTKLEQVHLFRTEDYAPGKISPGSIGFYDYFHDAIAIDYQVAISKGKSLIFNILLHEMIHMASCKKIFVAKKDKQDFGLAVSKTGYGISNSSDVNHEHFRAFNEAITSAVVSEIWEKNWREIASTIDEPEMPTDLPNQLETEKAETVKSFLNLVANFYNQDPEEFWQEVKRGMFSGQMMHLRKIERAWGPGSLRVLAALGSATKKDAPEYKLAMQFISEPDPEKREEIAHQLLNEREWLRYEKRQKKN